MRKNNRHILNILRLVPALIFALAVLFVPMRAKASGMVDLTREVSLTIEAIPTGMTTPVEGMTFRLYKVASVEESGEITLEPGIAAYGVSLDHTSADSWSNFATLVEQYLKRDNVAAAATGTTGADGRVVFNTASNRITAGIYLVSGDALTIGRRVFTPTSFLVSLPTANELSGFWMYDITATPKISVREIPEEPVSRRVLKSWEGPDPNRPTSIVVQLLRDGQVFEEQTLNAANNWSYQWDNLSQQYEWTVVERSVPANYTVTVTRNGITFQLVNTYTPPDTPPTVPPDTPPVTPPTPPTFDTPPVETPMVDTPEVLGATRRLIEEELPEVLGSRRLPQTGMLWWPVPVLFTVGLLMFINGFRDARYFR